MKKLLLLLFIIPVISFAQQDAAIRYQTDLMDSANDARQLRVNYKPTTVGTPYLYNQWKEGYLVINDSVMSPQKAIQVDLVNGELIVALDGERGMIIDDKDITGFAINKDDNVNRHYFVRLEPSTFEDTDRTSHFYEVITNLGKTNYLVKDVQKYLFDPNRSRGYQTENSFPQEYKERTYYYIKTRSGKYVKTKLNKKSILSLLDDKSSQVKGFVASKKINFKKEHDIVKVLDYYYSL